MENSIPLTCNVCKKSFSGPVPASQHYQSEVHKKKVIAEERMIKGAFSTTRYCDVCNIFCDTLHMLEKHKCSPRHMAIATKSKQLKSLESATGFMQKSVLNNEGQMTHTSVANNRIDEEYIFDGSRGNCNICNIELTSFAHCKQHLNGKNHTRAKARKNNGLNNPNVHLSCNACDIVFSGPECAKQHFESNKHKKRIQENFDLLSTVTDCPPLYEYSTAFVPTENLAHLSQNSGNSSPRGNDVYSALPSNSTNDPVERNPSNVELSQTNCRTLRINQNKDYEFDGDKGHCFVCNIELTSEAHASQHLLGQKHKKQAMKNSSIEDFSVPLTTESRPSPTSASEMDKEYTFNGITGHCFVCKIDLTSEAHANQHLSGKNHKKAVEQRKNLSSGNQQLYPLYCDICQKPFTGQVSALQHFSSEKHREKELIKQNVDKRSNVDEDESIICTIEGTVKWYTCTICACRVNSMNQLQQHKESPKHRHQLEKSFGTKHELPVQSFNADVRYQQASPKVPDTKSTQTVLKSPYISQPIEQFSSFGFTYSGDEPFFPSVLISDEFIDTPTNFDQKLQQIQCPDADECKRSEEIKSFTNDGNQNMQLPSFNVKTSLSSGFTDSPSLDINSLNDDLIFQETQLKVPYTEDQNATTTVKYDMLLNEKVNEKEETYKSLIQFDTKPGIRPNISEFKSDMRASKNENSVFMKISDLYLPNPDSLPKNIDSVPNVKVQKDLDNYWKKDLEKPSVEIIEPEVNTDSPVLISPKTVVLKNDSIQPVEKSDSNQSGKMQRNTLGSEEARAMKNHPKQVQSLTSNATLDSEYEEFLSFANNFENLDEFSYKASEMSLNDPGDQQKTLLPVSNASSSEKTCHQLHTSYQYNHNMDDKDTLNISPFPFHKYYCGICNRPMNSEKAYKDHLQGRAHLQKIAEEKAPMNRSHKPIVKDLNSYDQQFMDLTQTCPRSYQIELFGKAMEKDSVCFLPTGTGKTLISCMVMSAMLDHNPTRQVLFLVDKVLLVLQQAKYIRKELGDRLYRRFDTEDLSRIVERKLKIAELCGGQQSTDGVPLWKHDIIVITAAFCENLIGKEIIRWNDQCLLVFDEAHHCVKDHPFNKLLRDLLQKKRHSLPKILGLTASPAGRKTLPSTIQMLTHLTNNMGKTKISVVETNQRELKTYQSNAKIMVNFNPMTSKEILFKEALEVYLLHCYLRLAKETDINQNFHIDINALQRNNLSETELKELGREVVKDILELQDAIVMAHPKGNQQADRLMVDNLKQHTKNICMVLNVMFESGVKTAIEELQELSAGSLFSSFEFAESINLPCQPVIQQLETCLNIQSGSSTCIESSSQFHSLVHELISTKHVDWSNPRAVVLVLVKQRCTAISICRQLQEDEKIHEKKLRVIYVVGHGSGSEEQGMSVAQQRRVLEDIKAHKYQIVVATSVAEEGIDLPECELVITLNPPSTVTALVQMRGRARKRNSKFIVLCTNKDENAKLKELMLKEENMIKACNYQILNQNVHFAPKTRDNSTV